MIQMWKAYLSPNVVQPLDFKNINNLYYKYPQMI